MKNPPTDSATETTEAQNGNEPDMLQIAREADVATEATPLGGTEAKTEDKAKKPDADKATGKDGKPAEQGKDGKPAADGKAKSEEKDGQKKSGDGKQPDAKAGAEKSEFAKAKAETERKDRSWQALEKEKETFRNERSATLAELEGLRREVAEMRKRNQQPAGPVKDNRGMTVADYERVEQRYKKDGNDEMAEAAHEAAEELKKKGSETTDRQPAHATFDSPEFQSEWKRNAQELITKQPELGDPENPLVKATNTLIADPTYGRFFKSAPDGIKAAFDVACLMRDAHAAGETKKQLEAREVELTEAKKEVERLTGLLQPRGSHPAGPSGDKKAADLTADDVHAIARAADRGELDQK